MVKIQKAGWFRKGTRTAFCVIWGSVDFLTEDAGNASLQKSRETCKNADCRGTRQEEQTDEGDKTGGAARDGGAGQAAEGMAEGERGEAGGGAACPPEGAGDIRLYPREVQQLIADALHKPLTEIYGVSTFYSQFNLEPKGRNRISVCLGTACYIKGGGRIYQLLQEKLGIGDGGCTEDGRFSLDACRCLGCCGMAPVMMVNEDVYGSLTGDELDAILAKYE